MAMPRVLIVIAFAALVSCGEVEDVEQKKRGASKGNAINAIPTGSQKPEYTYSIYTQSPGSQISPASPTYSQSQVPNSFYPSQPGSVSQYYSSPNPQDPSSVYPPQPQLNLIPPPSTSQLLPFNFVQNPGYQTKFQIIPSKSANGNIQLAIIPQQQSYLPPQGYQLPQSLFSNPNQLQPQQNGVAQISPQGQYNIGQNYQSYPLQQPYVGHPSMLLFGPPNPSLYNNYVLPNPSQQLYNYYQSNPQSKYNLVYSGASQSNGASPSAEYEKYQAVAPNQALPKEDNEISVNTNEYIPADSSNNFKSTYSTGRGSSYKC